MFRVIFLGFLVFTTFCVVAPTSVYAISLDDEEEDAEDVADMLAAAQKAGKSEAFGKADALLKEAKMYGVKTDETQETEKLIASKKAAKAERERKERERLARIKREKEERARQASLAAQRQSYSTNDFRGIRKIDCYKISQYGPREVCLKGTGGSACYALQNYALREVCLKGAGSGACYSFSDYERRDICLKGVGSNACYSISNNYQKSNSCQKFSGSTEFWLIFSSYGYYTF